MAVPETIRWVGSASEGYLELLDQTALPHEVAYRSYCEVGPLVEAVRRLEVRGAPAIGIAAAYGCVLGVARGVERGLSPEEALTRSAEQLRASRPTAVNLGWALDRQLRIAPVDIEALLEEAVAIHREDARLCEQIGQCGIKLLTELCPQRGREGDQPLRVLTHCNAGALATGGLGTATAPLYLAAHEGWHLRVYADETRPLWQGARLTAWELMESGLDACVICDNMAAALMATGEVDVVIVGADRIAANGDTANKIGTYSLAISAAYHKIPFVVAAPYSTFDCSLTHGRQIPIEQRKSGEVVCPSGLAISRPDTPVWNPAFDVTPAELIAAIITDRGTIQPVNAEQIEKVLRAGELTTAR